MPSGAEPQVRAGTSGLAAPSTSNHPRSLRVCRLSATGTMRTAQQKEVQSNRKRTSQLGNGTGSCRPLVSLEWLSQGESPAAHGDSPTRAPSPLHWLCPSVLPFTMRRVSVGVRGFSGMPEEAVTLARASQAIKSSSWAPSWAAVPTVFYR